MGRSVKDWPPLKDPVERFSHLGSRSQIPFFVNFCGFRADNRDLPSGLELEANLGCGVIAMARMLAQMHSSVRLKKLLQWCTHFSVRNAVFW
jgi:hypothetical protein